MKYWCKVTVFFSWALTLICSHHLFLSHILSPSLLQTNPQLSGYVWTVVSERATADWPLDKGVHCPEQAAVILNSTDASEDRRSSDFLKWPIFFIKTSGYVSVSVALLAKQQLTTQIYYSFWISWIYNHDLIIKNSLMEVRAFTATTGPN